MKPPRWIFFTLVPSLFATSAVFGESNYPYFPVILHDQSGARNSVLMECNLEGEHRDRLSCDFFQMSVSYEVSPEEYQTKLEASITEILSDENQNPSTIANQVAQICGSVEEQIPEYDKKLQALSGSSKYQFYSEFKTLIEESCDLESSEQMREWMSRVVELSLSWDRVTCKVWPNTWNQEFTLRGGSGTSYWLSDSEPSGECGIVNISTIKNDGEYFWKYESRRVVTNKEATDTLMPCDQFEERVASYRWEPVEHLVNCKEIKFGF